MSISSLNAGLEAKKAELTAMVPPELMANFAKNVTTLQQRFTPSPPPVGSAAPVFQLPNQLGKSVSLSSLLTQNKYVVLVWYRGSWCPYCNVTLKAWRDRMSQLKALGATLVALSAEAPDESLDFRQKSDLNFEVLTDDGCAVSDKYGVAYDIGDDMLESHGQMGVKFAEINGNAGAARTPKLVVPAAVVVGKDGKVVFSEAMMDYTKRSEPDKIIAEIERL